MAEANPTVAAPAAHASSTCAAVGPTRLIERPLAVLVACLALAFAVYWPSLRGGFYNDDAMFLNMSTRVLEDPAQLFAQNALGYFRPTWLAYMAVQKAAFGLEPFGYHVVGVALHGLTGFLVCPVLT